MYSFAIGLLILSGICSIAAHFCHSRSLAEAAFIYLISALPQWALAAGRDLWLSAVEANTLSGETDSHPEE